MTARFEQSGAAAPQVLQCTCGQRFVVRPEHAGNRVKCPQCGQILVVPTVSSPDLAEQQVEDIDGGWGRAILIGFCAGVGILVIGGILFLAWRSYSSHQVEIAARQARIAAANNRISQAVSDANQWMVGKSALGAEVIEQQLVAALANEDATQTADAESALKQVRVRREQLAQQADVKQARQQATAVFDSAKQEIAAKHVTEAIALLQKYIADPQATDRGKAQRLLAESQTAISDSLTLDALVAMDEAEFAKMKAGGTIEDGKVTSPVLVAVRRETIERNLEKAAQQREEFRIAEQKAEEDDRLRQAEWEQRKQDELGRRDKLMKLSEEMKVEERTNPSRAVTIEEVHKNPKDYYGKYVRFVGVKTSSEFVRRQRDLDCFTVGVNTARGQPYSGAPADRLFFSTSNKIGREMLSGIAGQKEFSNITLFCQIRPFERRDAPTKTIPEAYIYRIEIYNLAGDIAQVYEE